MKIVPGDSQTSARIPETLVTLRLLVTTDCDNDPAMHWHIWIVLALCAVPPVGWKLAVRSPQRSPQRTGPGNGEGMSSDAIVVAVAVGVAAGTTLLGVWFAAWISSFERVRPGAAIPARHVELPPPVTAGASRTELLALAQELYAHADSTAAQAARARAGLDAARAALAAAEATVARAEAGYDAARLTYAAALGEAQAGRPDNPDPQAQEREREVSRAALDAYRRGEVPVELLQSVFGRSGPDPVQDERVREVDRLALAETAARHAFEHAVVAARLAREDLHIAEVAEAATQEEAAAAAMEAREAQIAIQAASPRRGGTGRKRASGTAHPVRRRTTK